MCARAVHSRWSVRAAAEQWPTDCAWYNAAGRGAARCCGPRGPPTPPAYTWATNRARTSYNNNNNIIAATTGFFVFSPTLRTIIFLLYFTVCALSPFPSSGEKRRGRPNTVPGLTTRPAPTQINNIVLNRHKCRVLRVRVSCVCMRFFQTFTVALFAYGFIFFCFSPCSQICGMAP